MTEKEPDIHNNHRGSGEARQWRSDEKHCHHPANQLSCPFREFQEPRTKFQQSFFGDWFLEFGSWNLLLGVDHVLSAAKKESQTQSVLALSQVPQASSHPPEALPNLSSST